jgi:hypothetical protein
VTTILPISIVCEDSILIPPPRILTSSPPPLRQSSITNFFKGATNKLGNVGSAGFAWLAGYPIRKSVVRPSLHDGAQAFKEKVATIPVAAEPHVLTASNGYNGKDLPVSNVGVMDASHDDEENDRNTCKTQ